MRPDRKRGYMTRYQCLDCSMFFRGTNERVCPICHSSHIVIDEEGVGD